MDLFDLPDPPAHHTDDPDSSREALDVHESSGQRAHNQRLVYSLVKSLSGSTAVELWANAPEHVQGQLKEMQEIRRRLCDLERKGLVQKGPIRPCRVRGTKQVTWVPFAA